MSPSPKTSRWLYEKVAAILATITDKDERDHMVDEFVDLFADDNPRFQSEKFGLAVEEHVTKLKAILGGGS